MTLGPGDTGEEQSADRGSAEAKLRRLDRLSPILVVAGLIVLGAMAFYLVHLRFKNPQRIDGVLTEQEALYIVQSESLLEMDWEEAIPLLEVAPVADPQREGEYTVAVEGRTPAAVRVLVEGGRVTAVRYELLPPG